MLLLPGHLWLTWFARGVSTLSPAGDTVTRDTWVLPPLWGSLSKGEPFGTLVLQEYKSFGSTSSSMTSLASLGWSSIIRPDNFLHLVATWWTERVNNGCDCAAPLTICRVSLSNSCWRTPQLCLDEQRGKVSALHPALRVLPGGGATSDRALCMHFIPLSQHTPLHHPPRPRRSGEEYEKGRIHCSSRQSMLSLYMPSACCHHLHL